MSDPVNAFAEMAQGQRYSDVSSLPLAYDAGSKSFTVPSLGAAGSKLEGFFPVVEAEPSIQPSPRLAKWVAALADSGNMLSLTPTYVARSEQQQPELLAAVEKAGFKPNVTLESSHAAHDKPFNPGNARAETPPPALTV